MPRLIFAALIFLVLGPVPGTRQDLVSMAQSDHAVAVPLDVPPAASGALRYIRGWTLHSRDSRFGGFSALAATGPHQFLLVGDNGRWASFMLSGDLRHAKGRIGSLPENGAERRSKALRDVEAMAYDPARGKIWLALEGEHQVWRLDAALRTIEARRRLPAARWSLNRGVEAMARLADGRFVLFVEGGGTDQGTPALLYRDDPATRKVAPLRFFYDSQGKGQVSDAAALPDGRVLIVHRKLGWSPIFTTIVAIADPARIGEGGVLRSRAIGTVPRALSENYEGAAITRESGRTYLWLVADDNFQRWQRSLLVQFELAEIEQGQQKGGAVTSPP